MSCGQEAVAQDASASKRFSTDRSAPVRSPLVVQFWVCSLPSENWGKRIGLFQGSDLVRSRAGLQLGRPVDLLAPDGGDLVLE
jgi:hypothetical protein